MTSVNYGSASRSTASLDRGKDWHRCCAEVMGFEWVEHLEEGHVEEKVNEEEDMQSRPIQQFISLLDEKPDADTNGTTTSAMSVNADLWLENALRVQADLTRMGQWIRSKKAAYVGVDMKEDEASLIQSTVAAFAATTASELETLRKIIPSTSDNSASHRKGVVQILLSQLQEQITTPFGILQKQRTRMAVQLWQNPMQCKLYLPKGSKQDETVNSPLQFFEDDGPSEQDQRFQPRYGSPEDDDASSMLAQYRRYKEESSQDDDDIPPRPAFLTSLASRPTVENQDESDEDDDITVETENLATRDDVLPTAASTVQQDSGALLPYEIQSQEETQRQLEEELQQEVALLTVAVNNDLDSVQKVEQRMVEITTLISQFSNLVSEQQENIHMIHESAEQTKDNMAKGQENLVDATERTRRSRHRLAWGIFALSMTLLFFHTLRS